MAGITTDIPIRVGHTSNAGRGVFAIRDIGYGELIHTADAVVAHPSLTSLHKVLCLLPLSLNLNFPSASFLIQLQFIEALM